MSFQSLARPSLRRALALSLSAHVLLLWPSPPGRQVEERSGSLTATLRPAVETRISRGPAPTAGAKPTPPARRRPEAVPSLDSALSAVASTAPNSARSNEPPPMPPADGVVNADGLRGYRLALAREAGRHKSYPQQAIDAGWSGTVQVQVTMPVDGLPRQALLASSGFVLLDSAATEMLRRALPTTPVPESLRGRAFSVTLPIVFELAQ